jgi:SSS family solute:Na+ symporter
MVVKGKIAAIILAVFSMLVAPLIAFAPQGLFQYLQTANGLYNVPIFTLILVGMFNKKVPAWAAKISLVAFILIYAFTQAIPLIDAGKLIACLPAFLQWFVGLHFLHILAILFVLSSAFMLAMGYFYPCSSSFDIQKDNKIVNTKPWKHALTASVLIAAAVTCLYILLSPLGIG